MLVTVVSFSVFVNILDQALCTLGSPSSANGQITRTEVRMLRSVAHDLISNLNVHSWEKEKYYDAVYNFMVKQAPNSPDILQEIDDSYKKRSYNDLIGQHTTLSDILNISDDIDIFKKSFSPSKDEDKGSNTASSDDSDGMAIAYPLRKYFTSTKDKDSRRISDGLKAKITDWPFVASINWNSYFLCAGVIIKSHLILTAASCVQKGFRRNIVYGRKNILTVRVGSHFHDFGGNQIDVATALIHPQFDENEESNNLAMLRLKEKLIFKREINKIDIGRASHSLGDVVSIAGWGLAKNHDAADKSSFLTYAELNIMDLQMCQCYYSKKVSEENFCANSMKYGYGARKYDVGGPAVMDGLLVGIISFVLPMCGKLGPPTIFTNLTSHADWIDRITNMAFNSSTTVATTPTSSMTTTKNQIRYGSNTDDKYQKILNSVKDNLIREHGLKNIHTNNIIEALKPYKKNDTVYRMLLTNILQLLYQIRNGNESVTQSPIRSWTRSSKYSMTYKQYTTLVDSELIETSDEVSINQNSDSDSNIARIDESYQKKTAENKSENSKKEAALDESEKDNDTDKYKVVGKEYKSKNKTYSNAFNLNRSEDDVNLKEPINHHDADAASDVSTVFVGEIHDASHEIIKEQDPTSSNDSVLPEPAGIEKTDNNPESVDIDDETDDSRSVNTIDEITPNYKKAFKIFTKTKFIKARNNTKDRQKL